jgi:hypothetical protein
MNDVKIFINNQIVTLDETDIRDIQYITTFKSKILHSITEPQPFLEPEEDISGTLTLTDKGLRRLFHKMIPAAGNPFYVITNAQSEDGGEPFYYGYCATGCTLSLISGPTKELKYKCKGLKTVIGAFDIVNKTGTRSTNFNYKPKSFDRKLATIVFYDGEETLDYSEFSFCVMVHNAKQDTITTVIYPYNPKEPK